MQNVFHCFPYLGLHFNVTFFVVKTISAVFFKVWRSNSYFNILTATQFGNTETPAEVNGSIPVAHNSNIIENHPIKKLKTIMVGIVVEPVTPGVHSVHRYYVSITNYVSFYKSFHRTLSVHYEHK